MKRRAEPAVTVELNLISDHQLRLVITNDATQKDSDVVKAVVAAERSENYEEGVSDAMSGTWQLRLIEARLPGIIAVKLSVPADGRVRGDLDFRF